MSSPDAQELLITARELLLKSLLPALPVSLHYDLRMIASAMAMAGREVELGAQEQILEEQALARLLNIYGLVGTTLTDAQILLSQAIRQGLYDQPSGGREALLSELFYVTQYKLRICNPKVITHEQ